MFLFGKKDDVSTPEGADELRHKALILRNSGRFDEAYKLYKRLYPVYEKAGDLNSQCSVLCSQAETTPNVREIPQLLEKIDEICASMQDPGLKAKSFRNLEALKVRLRQHRGV